MVTNGIYTNNTLQDQDFFSFDQVGSVAISNLSFNKFSKYSDKSRYAISIPTLALTPQLSTYSISNITFTNSMSSLLSVLQVEDMPSATQSNYTFLISDCVAANNSLSSKDSLIEFGEINDPSFSVQLSRMQIANNSLQLGMILQLSLNCREFLIQTSQITNNQGQFAYLEPASSDTSNPLRFKLQDSLFLKNYARADALVQLTTNS